MPRRKKGHWPRRHDATADMLGELLRSAGVPLHPARLVCGSPCYYQGRPAMVRDTTDASVYLVPNGEAAAGHWVSRTSPQLETLEEHAGRLRREKTHG